MTVKGHTDPAIVRLRKSVGVRLSKLEWIDEQISRRYRQMDLAEVPALRLLADNQWKALAKCLPDLKSTVHTGEVTLITEIQLKARP